MQKPYFMWPNCVMFGDPGVDSGYGGAHDADIAAPPNYEVVFLKSGIIVDLEYGFDWGMQVGVQMDNPINNASVISNLHLSAINPALRMGQHVNGYVDNHGNADVAGWVGGGNNAAMYAGTTNPTGNNYYNSPNSSSRIQVGVALVYGPVYGRDGWANFPPIDWALNPQPIIDEARKMWTMSLAGNPNVRKQFDLMWAHGGGRVGTGIENKLFNWYTQGGLRLHCPNGDEVSGFDYSGTIPGQLQQVGDFNLFWRDSDGKLFVYDEHAREIAQL